jgi:hypothetical protein
MGERRAVYYRPTWCDSWPSRSLACPEFQGGTGGSYVHRIRTRSGAHSNRPSARIPEDPPNSARLSACSSRCARRFTHTGSLTEGGQCTKWKKTYVQPSRHF